MHPAARRPPVERERRVVYTGVDPARREWDIVDPVDPVETRRAWPALNVQVRMRDGEGEFRRDKAELCTLPPERGPTLM